MGHSVLVLNRHFSAIAITDWRRAIALLYSDRALVVDQAYRTYDFGGWMDFSRQRPSHISGFIQTPSLSIALPDVIALKLFGQVPRRQVTFSRRNLYYHYGYHCQYCGERFPPERLNLDHVVPRSRGGTTDWSNVVPSCIPCNKRKGNRLPEEAGMSLQRRPSRPSAVAAPAFWRSNPTIIRDAWRQYL